jgi:hypothetical protein
MEFLNRFLTEDSSLLYHAIHSHFYWRILHPLMVFSDSNSTKYYVHEFPRRIRKKTLPLKYPTEKYLELVSDGLGPLVFCLQLVQLRHQRLSLQLCSGQPDLGGNKELLVMKHSLHSKKLSK